MPLACRVFELVGASLDSIVGALMGRGAGVTVERTGTGACGFVELEGGRRVPFEIFNFRGRAFLIVLAGRRRAATAARLLSQLVGAVVQEVHLRPEKFLGLYEGSVVKLVVFDMVRVPGLRRVVLTGDAVSDTELYRELSESCETRYILFQTGDGLVLGVSSSCTLVALTRIPEEELLSIVKEKILPLISPLV